MRELLCRRLALDDRAPHLLEADDLERTGLATTALHEVHVGDLCRGQLRLDRQRHAEGSLGAAWCEQTGNPGAEVAHGRLDRLLQNSRTCQHGAKAGVRNGQAADAASRKITLACQPGRHERAEHAIDATDPAEWRPPQERRAIPPLLNGVDAAIGPCLHEKRAAHLEAPPPLASEVALMQEVLVLEPAATRLLTDGERRFHVLRPTVCRNPGGIGWRPGGLSLKRPSMPQAAPSFGQPRPISQLGRAGRTLAGLVSTAALAGTRLRGRETPR